MLGFIVCSKADAEEVSLIYCTVPELKQKQKK